MVETPETVVTGMEEIPEDGITIFLIIAMISFVSFMATINFLNVLSFKMKNKDLNKGKGKEEVKTSRARKEDTITDPIIAIISFQGIVTKIMKSMKA